MRAILVDLCLSDRAELRVTRLLTVIGVPTVANGMWLTWTITQNG